MVKNKKGGKGAKSQGRKHVQPSTTQNRVLRLVQEEGEVYGCVTRHYGGAHCQVLCIDGTSRQCYMPNKFRGRSRRDNMIQAGAWVMVGIRLWESAKPNEALKCDLLEVYNYQEIERLKLTVNENWSRFNGIGSVVGPDNSDEEAEDAYVFDSRGDRRGGGGGVVAQEDFIRDDDDDDDGTNGGAGGPRRLNAPLKRSDTGDQERDREEGIDVGGIRMKIQDINIDDI